MSGLWRALRLRCPHCGERGIFRSWGQLVERCPRCAYSFEREEGYWLGAIIVNFGASEAVALALILGGILLTWPDVPWGAMTVVAMVLMAVFPLWFYPRTKTLWVWLDLKVHPYAGDERDWPGA